MYDLLDSQDQDQDQDQDCSETSSNPSITPKLYDSDSETCDYDSETCDYDDNNGCQFEAEAEAKVEAEAKAVAEAEAEAWVAECLCSRDEDEDEDNNEVDVDLINVDIQTFLNVYGINAVKYFFMYDTNNVHGIGSGADFHCRTILMQKIIDCHFEKIDHWFMEPKWDTFDPMVYKQIMGFFGSCIRRKIKMSLHFSPRICEALAQRTLDPIESMYYLQYIDPEIHQYVERMDPVYIESKESFESLGTGHESMESMIRQRIIINELTESQKQMAMSLDLEPVKIGMVSGYSDLIKLDQMISEPFAYTDQMIIKMFKVEPPYRYKDDNDLTDYQKMWDQMITSLTNEERKTMLILFTGSSDVNEEISVSVRRDMTIDIQIYACDRCGVIRRELFSSQETLNGLKHYFSNMNDVINDGDY
jgi:hypothetical protein